MDVIIYTLLCTIFVSIAEGLYTYNAAVVEYRPYATWTDGGGSHILRENVQTVVKFSIEAKLKGADIVVFPEYGLTGIEVGTNGIEFHSITQVVPNPEENVVLCQENINTHTYDALKDISCTAQNLQLYIIVDIAEIATSTEDEKAIYFNSQVVFDRKGAVIARYRKKHLFFEPYFTSGIDPYTSAVFTTDFGVTFALQICFDIMYEEPAFLNVVKQNVTNVVMSTYWIDELPFLTAPQIFAGWSTGLGINLLVSNLHIPENGAIGSGIFSGTFNNYVYTYTTKTTSTLIVKTLPKNMTQALDYKNMPYVHQTVDTSEGNNRFILHENMGNYTSKILEPTESNWKLEEICDRGVCCTTNYSNNGIENGETYRILVMDGIVGKGGLEYLMRVQTCAVVYCLNNTIESCANINNPLNIENGFVLDYLAGNFTTEFIYPTIFTTNFNLFADFTWEKVQKFGLITAGMKLNNALHNLLSATLFARYYQEDP